MSTGPRIKFAHRELSNVWQWMEEKKQIDWLQKQKILKELFALYSTSFK